MNGVSHSGLFHQTFFYFYGARFALRLETNANMLLADDSSFRTDCVKLSVMVSFFIQCVFCSTLVNYLFHRHCRWQKEQRKQRKQRNGTITFRLSNSGNAMRSLTSLGFLCSLLLDRQVADGFSTAVQRLSFERTKKVELPSFFGRLSSSTKSPADGSHNFIHRNFRLASAAKEEETDDKLDEVDDTSDAEADKKLAGRKKRLQMGYLFASMAYVLSALVTVAFYGSFSTKSFYFVFGGGKLNIALILYILKGAASHDRLNSDTYKRLNIAVILYAFSQLLIPTGNMGTLGRTSIQVPGFLALVNGIKGYGYGCLGWDKSKDTSTILTDIKQGIQSTLKGMTVIKAKSAGYIFGTLLLGSMFCFKLKDLFSILIFPTPETSTSFSILTRLSKMGRFGILTTIMYTLKDASDRDRLGGTTFVQLNLMAAAAFLSILLYLLPSIGTFSANSQVLIVGALCGMSLFKGLVNMKPKKA